MFFIIRDTFRFLRKKLNYTLVSVLGLSIGFFICIITLFFIKHELSFDRFHSNHENIYRLNTIYEFSSGDRTHLANSAPAIAPGVADLWPEIKKVSRLRYAMRNSFRVGEIMHYEDKGYYADSLFLEIFDFELLKGNAPTALDEPNTIVISEELATKYFKSPNPIGEMIIMNGDRPLKVTGILDNVPDNSHLNFDYLISFSSYLIPEGYLSDLSSWSWGGFQTYFELENGTNHLLFQDKMNELFEQKFPGEEVNILADIQPIENIYLDSSGISDDLNSGMRSGNWFVIYAMAAGATLIMLISYLNFINLSVASTMIRGKEIGIKKVMGVGKMQILIQLITESLLVVIIAFLISLGLISLSETFVMVLFPISFTIEIGEWMGIFGALVFIMGLVGGLYPALVLLRTDILDALKGKLSKGAGGGLRFRNGLILTQLIVSQGLIISALVIYNQLDYIQSKSLGFETENIIYMRLHNDEMENYYTKLKNTLYSQPGVLSIAQGERLIGEPWPFSSLHIEGDETGELYQIKANSVDEDYLQTFDINLVEGRFFDDASLTDRTGSIVLNESAVESIGLADPIGQRVYFWSDEPRTIIGVVEDFNYNSLYEEIGGMAFVMPFVIPDYMLVRVEQQNLAATISGIENTWKEVAPDVPFEFEFIDDKLEQAYSSEKYLSILINVFTLIAVVMACIGLFSIVSYVSRRRLAEISIRKVFGASISQCFQLLSREYIILIILATLVSFPIVYYVMDSWLNGFAYRINMGFSYFVVSFMLMILFTIVSVGYVVLKAALINPAVVLKDE